MGIDPGPGFRNGLAETFAIAPDDDELDAQWDLMRARRTATRC